MAHRPASMPAPSVSSNCDAAVSLYYGGVAGVQYASIGPAVFSRLLQLLSIHGIVRQSIIKKCTIVIIVSFVSLLVPRYRTSKLTIVQGSVHKSSS